MGPPSRRKCLLCRNEAESMSKDAKVKKSYAASLCTIFGLRDNHPFKVIYENAQYCSPCFQEVQEADLTLARLEITRQSLLRFQDRMYSKLGDNYFQIEKRDDLKVSYKEFENEWDSVKKRKFSYDEIVKIIYEKLDQECSNWERFTSENMIDRDVGADKRKESGTQTDDSSGASGGGESGLIILPSISDMDDQNDWTCEGNGDNDIGDDGPPCDADDDLRDTSLNATVSSYTTATGSGEGVTQTISKLAFTPLPTNFEKTISCTFDPENCKRFFYDEYNLKVHIKAFHEGNPKPHECSECGKAFSEEDRMKLHFLRVHASGGTLMCEHCGKGFSLPTLLKDHVRKMHLRRPPATYACRFCSESFKEEKECEEHEDKHRSNASPFSCLHCSLSLPNFQAAKKHYLVAHRDSPFRCTICDKIFASESGLRGHSKVHSQEFICDECPYVAPSLHGLKHHKMSHSNEKPYTCEVCGVSYKYSRNLTVHMRGHTGEKPYVCNLCGRMFRENSYLKRHQESHSADYNYECEYEGCKKKFKVRESLKKHVRYFHLGAKKNRKPKSKQKKVKDDKSVVEKSAKSNTGSPTKPKRKDKNNKKLGDGKKGQKRKAKPRRSIKINNEVKIDEDNAAREQHVERDTSQDELTTAVASIAEAQPSSSTFGNIIYQVQPTTYQILPISGTPVTVISTTTQDVNIPSQSIATSSRNHGQVQYQIAYKYE